MTKMNQVDHKGKGPELLLHVRKEVEAAGVVREEEGKKIVRIRKYTVKELVPKIRGVADLFFQDTFFKDNLDLKVGARLQGARRHRGMEFVPHLLAYVENRGDEVGHFVSMDIYGVFHIGDAIVTLAWETILGIDYYITPVHPMLDRSISLGINWQFLD